MNCKRFYKTDELITKGNVAFRRYSSTPLVDNSRLIQFVEGTLEELTPEDFGGVSVLPDNTLFCNFIADKLRKIELPDTVTSLGENALSNVNISEVIFGANTASIAENVCFYCDDDANPVADFSKAKSIPSRVKVENAANNSFSSYATIKVPSNLYNTWKNKSDWSDLSDKIVSV